MIGNMTIESQTVNDVLVVNLNGDLDAFTIQEVNKRLTQFIWGLREYPNLIL